MDWIPGHTNFAVVYGKKSPKRLASQVEKITSEVGQVEKK
jgi:hypothetical protein